MTVARKRLEQREQEPDERDCDSQGEQRSYARTRETTAARRGPCLRRAAKPVPSTASTTATATTLWRDEGRDVLSAARSRRLQRLVPLVVFVHVVLFVRLDLGLLVGLIVHLTLPVIDWLVTARLSDGWPLVLHGRLESCRRSSCIDVPRRRRWLRLGRFGWQVFGRRGFGRRVVGWRLGRRWRWHPFTLGPPSLALQTVALALLGRALVPLL